jgi:hypothetical protein
LLRIHDGVPLSWKWLTASLLLINCFFYPKSRRIAIEKFAAPHPGYARGYFNSRDPVPLSTLKTRLLFLSIKTDGLATHIRQVKVLKRV